MRSLISAVAIATVALACGRTREVQSPPTVVVVPDSFVRPSTGQQTQLAPVARGTIRLGETDTAGALPTPPNATGGGPPAESQTSVGSMSPTTVTGADSPLDSATTAPPHAGQPANPTMTGSAGAPAGPNAHGGVSGHPAGR